MDRLPPEIILGICRALCEDVTLPHASLVDLKSLRLCSRAFAGPAADRLFCEVFIFMDHQSLDNLKAIAEHPVYKDRVESVVFFGNMIAGDLLVKEEYENEIRGMTFDGPQHEQWGFDEDGKRSLTQEAIDEGYQNYLEALNEQSEAFQRLQSELPNALAAFNHLGVVSTDSFHAYLDEEIVQAQPAKVYNIARKTLAPLPGRLWTPIPYAHEGIISVCEAIARSRVLSRLLIPRVWHVPFRLAGPRDDWCRARISIKCRAKFEKIYSSLVCKRKRLAGRY